MTLHSEMDMARRLGAAIELDVQPERLSREIGVARHLLYHWRDRLEHANAPVGRSRELILRKQILALKRILANKTIEVDFFRRALQRVGARRRQGFVSGGEVSTTK